MGNHGMARPSDRALAASGQAPAGLAPSGFDPSRAWPLGERHQRLPKWARLEIVNLMCAQINAEMAPDIRGVAKEVLGGNCTFSDDDLNLLACLAVAAIDAGLHREIKDKRTVANIERAKAARASAIEARRAETAQAGSVGDESAVGEAETPNPQQVQP